MMTFWILCRYLRISAENRGFLFINRQGLFNIINNFPLLWARQFYGNVQLHIYYYLRGALLKLSDKRIRREIGKSCACFNPRRAVRLVNQRFDRAFREAGITANQFSILLASYNQEGILLTKIAKTLGMERTTLSRNLALLERRGAVSIALGGDKRERRTAITKKGIALLERTLPLWQEAASGPGGSGKVNAVATGFGDCGDIVGRTVLSNECQTILPSGGDKIVPDTAAEGD
jgi:DNA-binding MarR family transcriptional regulator